MDLANNNVIKFSGIAKKKDGVFANFKVKGIRGGAHFTASITVDILAADVDLGDSLEKIIENSANVALREFKKADFKFEGIGEV